LTVGEVLRACALDAREARLLLATASGLSESRLIGFPEQVLDESGEGRFRDYVARRMRGEPVAYILGRKEFYSLDLLVTPDVLIPRPETELLVERSLEREPRSVLDLGTGSGAIALALKRHLPRARIVAVDASRAALEVARGNARRLGLAVEFLEGRWFEPVTGRFDLVVANPPYVAEGDPHLADLGFEPRAALVAGADGLDAIRDICHRAPEHLEPGGWLLVEHGVGQAQAVRGLFARAGLEALETWPDLAGIPRVTGGRR
jgi:release factor glutamine methyltransferase